MLELLLLLLLGARVKLKLVLLLVAGLGGEAELVDLLELLSLLRLALIVDERLLCASVIDSRVVLTDAWLLRAGLLASAGVTGVEVEKLLKERRVGLLASVGVTGVEAKELLKGCGNHN